MPKEILGQGRRAKGENVKWNSPIWVVLVMLVIALMYATKKLETSYTQVIALTNAKKCDVDPPIKKPILKTGTNHL